MKIKINGKEIFFEKRVLLAEALKEAGFSVPLYCSGRGVCGRCAVYAKGGLSDKTESEKALPDGLRLACKTYAEGDCEISVNLGTKLPVLCFEKMPVHDAEKGYSVAVDVGTSTLAAVLLKDGEAVDFKCLENPHVSFGADVLTRTDADGLQLRKAIFELTEEFFEKFDVKRLCVCANTAMLYLLTETDTSPLKTSPFTVSEYFGKYSDIGLAVPAYIPHVISAFVGADALCGILLCELYAQGGDFLLCDIGTNCETACRTDRGIVCASAAAGSAFGEIGVPSELIKALYHLKCAGAIDKNGALSKESDLVYEGKAEYSESGDFLLASDIFRLLTDKAALRVAIDRVCSGKYPEKIFVSGAVGGADTESAMKGIGMIPDGVNVEFLQNSALAGAALIASHPKYEALSEELYKKCKTLSLTDDENFQKDLTKNMNIYGECKK